VCSCFDEFFKFFVLSWLVVEKTEKNHSCFARFCFHQPVFMTSGHELLNFGGKLNIQIKRIFILALHEMC
jgi:hypothetical protein